MTLLPYIGFALLALVAVAFVAWPIFNGSRGLTENRENTFPGRRSRTAELLLAGAVALFVVGIGGGFYMVVGQPRLALRAARGSDAASLRAMLASGDVNGLAPILIKRLRTNPDDPQGWTYLAQIYMAANDAQDAASAFGRALVAARRHGGEPPDLDLAYGEMLVQAGGGQVSPTAAAAFAAALAGDPRNAPARYYLGMAAAQKGDRATAARYWQGLLAEVPANAPLHSELVDRLASIGAAPPGVAGPGGAPDIGAMVSGLAARLQKNPNDPAGWLRLIRAYAVLGDTGKAKAALATARKSVGADASVKTALDSEARELKLD